MKNLISSTIRRLGLSSIILIAYGSEIIAQHSHLNVKVIDAQTNELTPVQAEDELNQKQKQAA